MIKERIDSIKKTYNVVYHNNEKNKIHVFFNMMYNLTRYNIGLSDYKKGNYLNIDKKLKKELLSKKEYDKVINYLDNPKYSTIFLDKIVFNNVFKDFVKRDYIDLRSCTKEKFLEFVKNKKYVFAKIPTGFGGHGVEKIDINSSNLNTVYKNLIKNKQYLVEDAIIQHKKLNEVNSKAVNNVRIVTLLANNKVHIIATVLRLSDGILDVVSCNDIMCSMDDNGKFKKDFACDDWLNIYYEHPVSKFKFKGEQMPYIKESIEMVKQAALVVPEVRYVGWDVAITKNGPCIIEGNFYPSYGLHQYYLLNDKYNFKQQLKDILKDEYKNIGIK